MKSMTGYGKGMALDGGRKVTIEIKSVNNRFLEINSRTPKGYMACDEIIRSAVQTRLSRGTVDVYFSCENNCEDAAVVVPNLALAKKYVDIATQLSQEFDIPSDMDSAKLMRIPDVVTIFSPEPDQDVFCSLTKLAILEAIDNLEKMRLCEGQTIAAFFAEVLASLNDSLDKITQKAHLIVDEYRQKILARVKEILKNVEVDEARLLNEVAFFADKSDIGEELSRLKSHFVQFERLIAESAPVGRQLDFISQEINREINTIASKSSDITITALTLSMKNDLEKIREQIRNVE